jgi:two-component system, NtrC family, sensor kinase
VGQLAAGIAHEINTPNGFVRSNLGAFDRALDKLQGHLDLQRQAVAAHCPEHVRQQLDAAWAEVKLDFVLADSRELVAESLEGTGRIRTIVSNLTSFARPAAPSMDQVNLNDCLLSTIAICRRKLEEKGTLVVETGELPPLVCHPGQINQVLLNLLLNAAKAIDGDGSITVRSWQENNEIRIAVSDTGRGIPEAHMHRIFEPFFTTGEVGEGTGLGLSVSHDIISRHGGSIQVVSALGSGSTFTVVLPIGI